ncbi:DUF1771-domain-containing protein [Xylaria palmicola]|nr:DUF1771-domain-containing protein [Xylaria palmicola]
MSAGIELERHHGDSLARGGNRFHDSSTGTHGHDPSERLREQAREAYRQKEACMQRAHEAYERGDGAGAKQLSNEGKKYAAQADEYNEEASQMSFSINNEGSGSDTIDLHGQTVHEALKFLTARIQANQREGRPYLHVIVGKGNHSVGHVQKIKPAVEELCSELGLPYETEQNAGRIRVDLKSGNASLPAQHDTYPGHGHQSHQGYQQEPYPGQQQQQHHGGQNQQEQQNDELEQCLTKLLKKFCCTVM